MKLEIKHLAPYLPYGLKCYYPEKLPFSEFFEKKVEQHTAEMGVISMMGVLKGFSKPILRPLCELDVDDEVNTPEYLQGCCYSYVQKLLSEHFDVFGLIEKGLAIDINTLNKEI